jgi:hypothetical protein
MAWVYLVFLVISAKRFDKQSYRMNIFIKGNSIAQHDFDASV